MFVSAKRGGQWTCRDRKKVVCYSEVTGKKCKAAALGRELRKNSLPGGRGQLVEIRAMKGEQEAGEEAMAWDSKPGCDQQQRGGWGRHQGTEWPRSLERGEDSM